MQVMTEFANSYDLKMRQQYLRPLEFSEISSFSMSKRACHNEFNLKIKKQHLFKFILCLVSYEAQFPCFVTRQTKII